MGEKLTTQIVARIMGKSDEFVRVGLQRRITSLWLCYKTS